MGWQSIRISVATFELMDRAIDGYICNNDLEGLGVLGKNLIN